MWTWQMCRQVHAHRCCLWLPQTIACDDGTMACRVHRPAGCPARRVLVESLRSTVASTTVYWTLALVADAARVLMEVMEVMEMTTLTCVG